MSEFVLIDSDILIDAGKQLDDAIKCLESLERESTLSISTITQMELIVGCRNQRELTNIDNFLKRFHVFNLNESICITAIDLLCKYRLSHGLHIADALIAATSITLNIPFITKNQKHFRYIKEIQVMAYPTKS